MFNPYRIYASPTIQFSKIKRHFRSVAFYALILPKSIPFFSSNFGAMQAGCLCDFPGVVKD